ncbi:MAG: tetratricopeptide repeat protein [Acidobacteria bacterium]|nr:tetratricopeptide repeat protein [Acidobacteriota bacterium]
MARRAHQSVGNSGSGSVAIALFAAVFTASLAAAAADAPSRILVAPLPEGSPAGADAVGLMVSSLPTWIAEAISAEGRETASLAHDLSPDTTESLGLGGGPIPPLAAAAKLAGADDAKALIGDGSVRILVFPSVASSAGKTTLSLRWIDLVAGKDGTVSATAANAAGLVDAVVKAVSSARDGWRRAFALPAAGAAAKADRIASAPLGACASKLPEANAAWARAETAWNHGDVPAAESALTAALASDSAFDLARVDLAWIRFAQGRATEAAALASTAARGRRLTLTARARAEIIAAAAAGQPAELDALAPRLKRDLPGAPWESLATALSLNLQGEHYRAVAPLDIVRIHRPNDPAILHEAGMAALGLGDAAEAQELLRRVVAAWPAHDRAQMDLAEAFVRARDLDGAAKSLEAWAQGYHPGDAPVWGGAYTFDDPPPIVRSQVVSLLKGAVSKAIESLDKKESLYDAASAPAPVRVIVLQTLYDLQSELAFGGELQKQKWLDAARESFNKLRDVMPAGDRKARPWILFRMEALLRVREGRFPEARALREKIAAASAMPGYDAAALDDVDAAIALKDADTDKVFEVLNRAVESRGSVADLYALGQAYGVTSQWKKTREIVTKIEGRIETWSEARRPDALLWNTRTALLVPFIYSLGGEVGVWLDDVESSRKRFGIFLGYFKTPDEPFRAFADEASGRGATAAW